MEISWTKVQIVHLSGILLESSHFSPSQIFSCREKKGRKQERRKRMGEREDEEERMKKGKRKEKERTREKGKENKREEKK